MNQFIVDILAAVIGGLILVWAATLISREARWVLTGILGRLLNIDIDYVFKNKSDAQSDLKDELKQAREVYILTGRGNELQREAFASLFHEKPQKREVKVRVLLPKTGVDPGEYDWTWQRETELAKFDQAYGNGFLRRQIEASDLFIQRYLAENSMDMRRFNAPHMGRIIITDRYLYYTPYRNDAHGRDSKVYKLRRGGEMYDNFLRLFEQLWSASAQLPEKALGQADHIDLKGVASEAGTAVKPLTS